MVAQIPCSDIAPGKEGIAFGAINKGGKILSELPLAVLTPTPVPDELRGSLIVTDLRYPAQYEATAEPVLIQGSLVLLAQATIMRKQSQARPRPSLAPHCVSGPMIGQSGPCWSRFRCCSFAGPKDAEQHAKKSIGPRRVESWLSAAGKFCAPIEATQFSAMIRVPSSAQLSIQLASGINGLYVEPRSQRGKLADQNYGVVWMQNATLQDIKHKLTTVKHAVCACRMMSKYGPRFAQEHLEEAYSTLRPSDTLGSLRSSSCIRCRMAHSEAAFSAG